MRSFKFSTCLPLIVACATMGLAACSDRLLEAPPLGGSIAQNNAAQIVNAEPASTEVAPPLNGERNNAAQTRYEKGKIIKPEDVRTSSTGGTR